jgi:hypothetical protein
MNSCGCGIQTNFTETSIHPDDSNNDFLLFSFFIVVDFAAVSETIASLSQIKGILHFECRLLSVDDCIVFT